jgi:hypothetical protein
MWKQALVFLYILSKQLRDYKIFIVNTFYIILKVFNQLDPEDPRIQTTWGNSKECFKKAAELFSPQFKVEPVEIPYEQTTLPGYFYSGNNNNTTSSSKQKRPPLIAHGGFDSTLEELYTAAAAICGAAWLVPDSSAYSPS